MREIKFRGKDAKTKEWVYGVPYTKEIFSTEHKKIIGYKTYIITYLADDLRSIEREEVDPNTVGQYTGLHDKNGKEIYEGDIVKTKYNSIASILYGNFIDTKQHQQVGFHQHILEEDGWFNGTRDYIDGTMDYIDNTCLVIGNIHESVVSL